MTEMIIFIGQRNSFYGTDVDWPLIINSTFEKTILECKSALISNNATVGNLIALFVTPKNVHIDCSAYTRWYDITKYIVSDNHDTQEEYMGRVYIDVLHNLDSCAKVQHIK